MTITMTTDSINPCLIIAVSWKGTAYEVSVRCTPLRPIEPSVEVIRSISVYPWPDRTILQAVIEISRLAVYREARDATTLERRTGSQHAYARLSRYHQFLSLETDAS